jgi:hypothetical protein
MPRYRVAIYGQSYKSMLDLVNKHRINVLDHGSRKLNDRLYRAYAFLDDPEINRIETAGYRIVRHEDVDQTAKLRQAEVGTGDRYQNRRRS